MKKRALLLIASLATSGSTAAAQRQAPRSAAPGQERAATVDEKKLQVELNRILEYPAADRIKRLRFFIKSNPASTVTLRAAKEALNAALVEIGEQPTETIEPEPTAPPAGETPAAPSTEAVAEPVAPEPQPEETKPAAVSVSPATERRLKAELNRLLEYPAADRIKRLRFFIKSNPDSALRAEAEQALATASAETGAPAEETTSTAPAAETTEKSVTATATATVAVGPDEKTAATTTDPGPGEPPAAEPPARVYEGELGRILAQPLESRIKALQSFVKSNSAASAQGGPAAELLVAALAESGDEKLKTGDVSGGLAMFRSAVNAAAPSMSEKLYVGVIGQIPSNLFLRGQTAAAAEIARDIETKIAAGSAKRLLMLAAFYLSVEQAGEAARVANQAVELAPELAAAHQSLGAAHHIGLNLEKAAAEYARAVELDPKLLAARRSLADLRRANNQPEEALTLYRELLDAEPKDLAARAGMVLALFEADQREAAERELEAALKEPTPNLSLLAGAAYWYAARGEGERAFQLASQAAAVEPRYTWAQIALARAQLLLKRPLDAERALRFARQYGRFPTLDYELATALAAAGLYDEAAEELGRSFVWQKGEIQTQLAGTQAASAATFTDLLAPERRASIFQPRAADSEANAQMLKGLLALHAALGASAGGGEAVAQAAQDFVTGGPEAVRSLRQLYVAELLVEKDLALPTAFALVEASVGGVEAALDAPHATVAVLAGDLRTVRARALAAGGTPDFPELPRDLLSKIIRGRIEGAAGWALFNQDQAAEALVRLRRAASVLPENSRWWRSALWRLGTVLETAGTQEEALASYIKSYQGGPPDVGRRAVIEALYRKMNGSLDGLDAKIGATSGAAAAPLVPDTRPN